jgi:hypothetical protein
MQKVEYTLETAEPVFMEYAKKLYGIVKDAPPEDSSVTIDNYDMRLDDERMKEPETHIMIASLCQKYFAVRCFTAI